MTIYEISENIKKLLDEKMVVDEETGEILFDESSLDELKETFEEKIENLSLYIKELDYEAKAIAEEVRKLESRKRANENKGKRLKEYLMFVLNGEKFKTPKISISYRNSESIDYDSIDDVPEQFIRTKLEVDKTLVKEAFSQGLEVDGCRLVKKTNIIVK